MYPTYHHCVMLLFGGHETTRNLIGNGGRRYARTGRVRDHLHDRRSTA